VGVGETGLPVSPSPRAAWILAGVALSVLVVPPALAALAALAVLAAIAVDAAAARPPPSAVRHVPPVLARGVAAPLAIEVERPGATTARVRQPVPPDLVVTPAEADGRLEATLVARRRGRQPLPAPAVRLEGPLRLGRWFHRVGEPGEVLVYPDMPTAHRLVAAVRQGRFRDPGLLTRGPLGLGTDFESIRDYVPDDDIRQVNWRATARVGRPMSNQYRVEQDREVICCIDAGRLMAAPLDGLTRLDAAVDAAVAVALVADEVGDHCGALAFDDRLRRRVAPRRRGARAVVEALFDLEPTPVESDYELAFRSVGGGKRALVLVFTDLLEESAARPLVEAIPVIARRHHVVVAGTRDPGLDELVRTPPSQVLDVLATTVALDVLDARARVTAQLRRAGADVLEAPADGLAAACVATYLRAKARARL
jgi:uncharacterized protein (DUF58 family)